MFPAGLLVQVLGDLGPRGQPVVAHVLPRLVVVPPAAGVERLLYLEGIDISIFGNGTQIAD